MTVKTKRVLNRWFLVLLSVVLIVIISIFKIPSFLKDRSLENLGYDREAITAIKKLKLTKTIIDNDYYSDYLKDEIKKENFKTDYLKLYLNNEALSDDDFLLYDKLSVKGYSEEELLKLFKELDFYELTPLLVFDKVNSISNYISDCKSHTENSPTVFNLSNDYLKPYINTTDVLKPGDVSMLVSQKYYLGDYTPSKLVPLSSMHASDGVEIDNEAYEAYTELWDAMMKEGLGIYALSGYRSFETQKSIYDAYPNSEEADIYVTRPGYAESQTGLSLSVVDARNERLSTFGETEEYQYLKKHAHEYGFIIRYPENKSSITGYNFIPYQIRYVGKDVAKKIHDSNLTYEEYYLLYLN